MKLQWDQTGEKIYELGIDHGVLYRHKKTTDPESHKVTIDPYAVGYVWNGLTSVDEGAEGGEANPQWADNMKYLNITGAEEFNPTINAFTYPDAFAECDGSKEILPGVFISAQERQEFGFSYRTKVGNDVEGESFAYKLHLCYGMRAEPSDRTYETINDSPEAMEFSWDCTTTPVQVPGAKPTAHLFFQSNLVPAAFMEAIEAILYGTEDAEPRLPLPEEVIKIYEEALNKEQQPVSPPAAETGPGGDG